MTEHTIELKSTPLDDKFHVYEWSTYPRSSVLAGQACKRFVTWFDTEAEATAAYPEADLGYRSANNTFNHLPGEDDPVPGGALPDDIGDWPPAP